MNSKYLTLIDEAMNRYQRGGFSVGDWVKFADSFMKKEGFKNLNETMQERIKELEKMSQQLNLRVVKIKNKYPSSQPDNEYNNTGNSFVDIALDYGGGRFYGETTVPSDLLTIVNTGENLAPIPDALRRDNTVTLKPEPLEQDEETEVFKRSHKTDQGGKDKKSDTKLASKNTKIPSSSAKGVPDPAVDSYTIKYLR